MSKRFYRCENEYGPDPCEFARSDYKIPEEQVSSPMDGANPRCPGKTKLGAICGRPLVLIPSGPPIINSRYALFGGSALAVVVFGGWLLWGMFEPSQGPDPPVVIQEPKPPQPSDPWWVYRRLESSSTILSKEP